MLQTGYSATLYTDFDQGFFFLQSEYHTVSSRTCKCCFFYAHKQSTTVPAAIFTQITHSAALCAGLLYRMSQRCVQVCCTECHTERKITERRSFDWTSFVALRKVCSDSGDFREGRVGQYSFVDIWIQDYPNLNKTYKIRQNSVYGLTYGVTVIGPNFRELSCLPEHFHKELLHQI